MIAMLPKKVNCQSSCVEFDDQEIEKDIATAEFLADKALQDITKKENYYVKKRREKVKRNG